MKRTWVIHPFFFAIWPVLFVYASNQEQLALAQVWPSLLVFLASTSIAFLLFTLILRDGRRSGILLSLFLFLFFSFGQVLQTVPVAPVTLLIAWAAILAGGTLFGVMTKRGLDEITKILNVVSSVLVLFSTATIAIHGYASRTAQQGRIEFEPMEIVADESWQDDALPDIYYIILDGYARADVLEELYSYDNSEFLEFLKQRGFFVAANSRANYAHTALSLASSLNLSYLDDVAAQIGEETEDRDPLGVLIEHSAVIDFLRQRGYTIVTFPTGYTPTTLDDADIQMRPDWTPNELEIGLLLTTPIPWLVVSNSEFNPQTPHGSRILDTLNHLVDTAQVASPHFVFAHILGPHAPFVLDEDGNTIDSERSFNLGEGSHFFELGGTRDEYLNGYVGQLSFINKRIRAVIDDLLARSSQPPIIILQADHGPGLLLNWDDPENTYFKERFSILNAVLLPGGATGDLYDEITPVNTFRLILNRYFGADLDLLEDRSYFSTWQRPYQFIDVTDSPQMYQIQP